MAKKENSTGNHRENEEEPSELKEEPSDDKEDKEERDKKESSIYVKVTEEIRNIIDRHKKEGKTISSIVESALIMYDGYSSMAPDVQAILDKYVEEYDSKINVVEEALRLLEAQKDITKSDTMDLWCRARDRGMMLIGKTTFNQLLAAAAAKKDSLERPQRKNNAMDIILWYLGPGKTIKNITLRDIVYAIQTMWTVSNYFDKIEVTEEGDTFYLSFMHQQHLNYSTYWLGYFQILFEMLHAHAVVPFKCSIEGEPFEQTISLTIKELYEKDSEETSS